MSAKYEKVAAEMAARKPSYVEEKFDEHLRACFPDYQPDEKMRKFLLHLFEAGWSGAMGVVDLRVFAARGGKLNEEDGEVGAYVEVPDDFLNKTPKALREAREARDVR